MHYGRETYPAIAVGALIALSFVQFAHAAAPCDFKGLWVGDRATPQQIMSHFGIKKFVTESLDRQSAKDFDAFQKRAQEVGLSNAFEEQERIIGPSCDLNSCSIPYGYARVGNEPFPILVGVQAFFDQQHDITAIDVSFDSMRWDEIRELVNAKYGNDWTETETRDVTIDYETKKSWPDSTIALKHRTPGINQKTNDQCSIDVSSRDIVFAHSTPPALRAFMELKLISKNF